MNCAYSYCADNETFHRRAYWLLTKSDIVFVHYLDVRCILEGRASSDDAPTLVIAPQNIEAQLLTEYGKIVRLVSIF
jgi:hypothetical protein